MADWVWVESSGARAMRTPRIKSSRFGDGYEQRAPDGINFMDLVWEIPFDEVDDAIADEMVAFLEAQQGHIPFSYVPLRQTAAIRVICRTWDRTHTAPGESSLRCRFEQIFEP